MMQKIFGMQFQPFLIQLRSSSGLMNHLPIDVML
ncbi:hypothetical protein Ccrd_006505 [Cynara cardunculus var. scolymus]|uniref:Uncharacterized protein n=1 Tax=Cynara cardunculus var. scolymus TaxID=59895 RepID=A0A103XIU9_CYNCS|nr:hypothetical protein Ccrd_006505 [Cynara cardunculus var. scolymus]